MEAIRNQETPLVTQLETAIQDIPELTLSWFNTHLADLGVSPGVSEGEFEQLNRLYNALVTANKTMNLTRISQPSDVYIGHFLDSLTLLCYLTVPAEAPITLVDIGSGAGFPALVMAIVRPAWSIIAIESTQKKAAHIETTANTLGLRNITVLAQRAEAVGQTPIYRESADIVTARAVSRVGVLAELGLPLLKVGGSLWLFKTIEKAAPECAQATKALTLLGGSTPTQHTFSSPLFDQRCLINVIKQGKTPSLYPRRDGLPEKNPL